MRADEYLKQAKRLDSLIENKREEERELRALAVSVTANCNDMPRASGVSDKVGNTVSKIIAVQEQINDMIDKYVDVKQDIVRHLEMLPRKQYEVLYWLYVKKREKRKPGQKLYYSWAEVAENLGCSEENIRKTRRRAVKNLQKILDSEKGLLEVE